MTEIDLHGFKHDEVEDKLANLLILHYNMSNFPVRIITGKSEKDEKIVRETCEVQGFTIDDFWNDNPGDNNKELKMEALQILGWIYLGIMLGSIGGFLALGLFVGPKMKDYEQEIDELRLQRQLLKGEIDRISRRGKPQPRKRRNWKKKPRKK